MVHNYYNNATQRGLAIFVPWWHFSQLTTNRKEQSTNTQPKLSLGRTLNHSRSWSNSQEAYRSIHPCMSECRGWRTEGSWVVAVRGTSVLLRILFRDNCNDSMHGDIMDWMMEISHRDFERPRLKRRRARMEETRKWHGWSTERTTALSKPLE